MFDIKGNFIIEPVFDYVDCHQFSDGLAVVELDGKMGYINTKGEWVIEPKFDDAHEFSEGLATVELDDKWGYVNTEGEWVVEPKFDYAHEFSEGLALVELDGKWGYINTKGEWVIEPYTKKRGKKQIIKSAKSSQKNNEEN